MSSNVDPITTSIIIDVSRQVAQVTEVADTINSVKTFAATYAEGLNRKLAPYGVKVTMMISFSMESEGATNEQSASVG